MDTWLDVFDDNKSDEIEKFIIEKMRECGKGVCEMEYALHKIVGIAVYDYKVENALGE